MTESSGPAPAAHDAALLDDRLHRLRVRLDELRGRL